MIFDGLLDFFPAKIDWQVFRIRWAGKMSQLLGDDIGGDFFIEISIEERYQRID